MNMPIAFATVGAEHKINVRWFLHLCMDSKIGLFSGTPLFCDNGCLLNVAKDLYVELGLVLNLRCYTLHILSNVSSELKVSFVKSETLSGLSKD